ncbi:MAG: SEC-C metal-binding domain-containing protein, partial [Actinomycetota bacterium]|nr:SEC-C metal-binding domain-containing protein [Actinomycetota bacterium]
AVTVATNMAGRGVDIVLGGNPEGMAQQEMIARGWDVEAYMLDEYSDKDRADYEAEFQPLFEKFRKQCGAEREEVLKAGGLYVLGTERHDSRRIDNQLRGRSGRQGDPGESRFYLSLEDDLMRLFASDRIAGVMERLKIPDDIPIEAKMVSKAIERAQTQVESMNFEIRKNVLKYDEVMDKQRQVIYGERRSILEGEDFRETAIELVTDVVEGIVDANANPDVAPDDWDWEQLFASVREVFPTTLEPEAFDKQTADYEDLRERFLADALDVYNKREQDMGSEQMRNIERLVLLNVIDNRWREHLYEMDYLQEGIGLRAMAQKDPLVEYQREGYDMFGAMQESIKVDFARYMFHVETVRRDEQRERPARMRQERRQVPITAGQGGAGSGEESGTAQGGEEAAFVQARSEKIPRNAPCPCGSGKKYKQCHGAPGAEPL